jgi:hypothetical protein
MVEVDAKNAVSNLFPATRDSKSRRNEDPEAPLFVCLRDFCGNQIPELCSVYGVVWQLTPAECELQSAKLRSVGLKWVLSLREAMKSSKTFSVARKCPEGFEQIVRKLR